MTLTKRTLSALAASSALLLTLGACGGGDGGRPSVDDISESLQDSDIMGGEVDAKVADCVAEAFHDSDLSDEALQAIVDQDEDYEPSDDDEKAIESVQSDEMTECVTEGMDLPEMPEDPEAS